MPSDFISQSDNNIDDLIRQSRRSAAGPRVSSEEVEEKLKKKIQDIEDRKKEEIAKAEAKRLGVSYISLKGFPISPEALLLVGEAEAKRLGVVCFYKSDREARLGALDPIKAEVIELLEKIKNDFHLEGEIYKISQKSLDYAIGLYRTIPKPHKSIGGMEITARDLEKFQREIKTYKDIAERIQHVSATEVLTLVMAGAIQINASDVHIEAEQDDVKIRYRIDGVLYDVALLPKKDWPKIINRVKLISGLKININNIPQDGRFTIYLDKEFIDIRVSTVPSAYGESIVMRLLMSSAAGLELEDLGLVGPSYEIMKKEILRPNGMILTTGPTGSGKTTTLYSILKKLNQPETKIITLENPIEYRIKGITQSQVESSTGESGFNRQELGENKVHFTYASGLRAVLRQDPDIVMVGEIRDQETAEIAIQAALTGHLMLSTLHTNSAAGAIPRLLSMEVKPFLLAPSLNVIIGQRLVRKICPVCKEEVQVSAEELDRVKKILASIPDNFRKDIDLENIKFYQGRGCEACSGIGYKGRLGIFEILTMNKDIEKLILTGQVSEYEIQEIAQRYGMLTMVQDGMLKAVKGITTPGEVFSKTD